MIYVTGYDGFIGREVMKFLPDAIGISKDLNQLTSEDFPNVTKVLHLAAAGVQAKNRNWEECFEVNVLGASNLLESLKGYNVPVVMARSFMEDAKIWDNPYFSTKRFSYDLSKRHSNVRFVKIFHVYGPEMDGVLKYAKDCLLAGSPATFGSGLGQRDWIHVSDAARGIVAALSGNYDYDIGTGKLTSLRSVIEMMKEISGSSSKLIFDPARDRNDTDVLLKAENLPVGWSPEFSLTRGLAELMA